MASLEFHGGGGNRGGQSFYFEVTVGPQPETIENFVKRLFVIIGLKEPATIKAFENFAGQSFFEKIVRDSRNNAVVAAAVTRPQGITQKVQIHVFPAVVEALKRFGINLLVNKDGRVNYSGHARRFAENVQKYRNFTPAPTTPVSGYFYNASAVFPAFFVVFLGLTLFPDCKTERIARGEDISELEGWRLLTARWRVILVLALTAGAVNFLLLNFL